MAVSRGRKITTVLVVLFVVLVGLLVVSDRLAAYAAERTIATQTKKELAARDITTPSEPAGALGGVGGGDVNPTGVATGTVQVGGAVVHVNIPRGDTGGGSIPPVISRLIGSIKRSLSVDVRIPQLPYNLKVRSVKAAPQGLSVTA